MAAGDSIISICNSALITLGMDLIVSLTEASKAAILLSARYDAVRRKVLRSHPWTCAVQQVALPLSAYVPLVLYDYAYALPADCLRFLDLPDNDKAEWEIGSDANYGNLLLSNEQAPLNGRYIRDLTDPTRFDAELVETLQLALAKDVCLPLTEDKSKKQMVANDYKDAMASAQHSDSEQQSPQELDDDLWLRARQ